MFYKVIRLDLRNQTSYRSKLPKEVQTSSRKLNFHWKFELPVLKKARNSAKLSNLLFYTIFIMKYESWKKIFGSWNFQNAQFIDALVQKHLHLTTSFIAILTFSTVFGHDEHFLIVFRSWKFFEIPIFWGSSIGVQKIKFSTSKNYQKIFIMPKTRKYLSVWQAF